MSEIAIYHYPLAFKSPDGGVPLGQFSVDVNGWPRYRMVTKKDQKAPIPIVLLNDSFGNRRFLKGVRQFERQFQVDGNVARNQSMDRWIGE